MRWTCAAHMDSVQSHPTVAASLWLKSGGRSQKMKIRIEDPPRRKHMVFLGGAVLAHIMKDKPEFWYTKAEYQEQGAARAHPAARRAMPVIHV